MPLHLRPLVASSCVRPVRRATGLDFYPRADVAVAAGPGMTRWAVGGHSLGGRRGFVDVMEWADCRKIGGEVVNKATRKVLNASDLDLVLGAHEYSKLYRRRASARVGTNESSRTATQRHEARKHAR